MGLLNSFLRSKLAESVVLIDIGAGSVAGAYARYEEDEAPALLYTRRVPIEMREGEARERAMLRALEVLGGILVREGAPTLARATGSGRADVILVSIDAPWQKTSIRIEHIEQENPFIFTKSLVTKALENRAAVPEKLLVDESVIGTLLNGYETSNPYGKRAHRASVIVLTSLIEAKIAERVVSVLRSLYHTRHILTIASSSLRYQTMRAAFPHERNMLMLDATGPVTSVILVRNGFFVAVSEAADTDVESRSWVRTVTDEFAEIAKQYPLPRTIFLLARPSEMSSVRERLGAENFGSLWLSDNPPKIVPILANQIGGTIRQGTAAAPDLAITLMALYWHQSGFKKET